MRKEALEHVHYQADSALLLSNEYHGQGAKG
jgi:hypothetical protein